MAGLELVRNSSAGIEGVHRKSCPEKVELAVSSVWSDRWVGSSDHVEVWKVEPDFLGPGIVSPEMVQDGVLPRLFGTGCCSSEVGEG